MPLYVPTQFPPWIEPSYKVNPSLIQYTDTFSAEQAALATIASYNQALHIYTDGSLDEEGNGGYAFWIPSKHVSRQASVRKNLPIFVIEFLAILQSLCWIEKTKTQGEAVIFTDSLSVVSLLCSRAITSPYAFLVEQILEITQDLPCLVTIQWIPGHKGIKGNEEVDHLAKEAKFCTDPVQVRYTHAEVATELQRAIWSSWQRQWDSSPKGRHLYAIKPVLGKWDIEGESRRIQVVLSRLRTGHAKINSCLYRLHQVTSPLCSECYVQETVPHILLSCTKFNRQRSTLRMSLNELWDQGLKPLLGDAILCNLSPEQNGLIFSALRKFLHDSGLLHSL